MKTTSIKDPIISGARDLQSSSKRKELGKALLYGVEQINWAIKNSVEIEFIFTTFKEREDTFSAISTDKIIEVSEGVLKKISGTNYLIPYIAVAKINQSNLINSDFVVVLDGLIERQL